MLLSTEEVGESKEELDELEREQEKKKEQEKQEDTEIENSEEDDKKQNEKESEKGNFNKVKDNYLKKNGIDAHELKKDI